ncbi:MAG: DUF5655 domain-containing protein [Bacteroidota bacterium]
MAKTSQEIEKEFIEGIKDHTGKSLSEWMSYLKEFGMTKRNELLNLLKDKEGFRHQDASLLAGIYVNGGKPVYGDAVDLLENQFNKKEHLRPLYDHIMEQILRRLPETKVIAKKTYVSLNAKREYAAIGIKSKEIRLAMDLDGEPDGNNYLKQTGIGCMPRISHMVKFIHVSQISDTLLNDLEVAFKRMS